MAKKILFINQEISPYVPESEMSAMGRRAPQRVFEKGFEIRTFMPKWGNINENGVDTDYENTIRIRTRKMYYASKSFAIDASKFSGFIIDCVLYNEDGVKQGYVFSGDYYVIPANTYYRVVLRNGTGAVLSIDEILEKSVF